jgi:hypothetical protein
VQLRKGGLTHQSLSVVRSLTQEFKKPVIVLYGWPDLETFPRTVLEAGAIAVLRVPPNPEEFERAVKECLDPNHSEKPFSPSGYDFNRPYMDLDSLDLFTAVRAKDARKYGKTVRAFVLSNREYQRRFGRFAKQNNMKPPPGSHIHIMLGYLVVRRLGTPAQYETWMPDYVFEGLYEKEEA